MQYRPPFDVSLSIPNAFLKLILATKIHTHTHNIDVIQLQTSQDDQMLVPLDSNKHTNQLQMPSPGGFII